MTVRRPLALVSGTLQEIPDTDSLPAALVPAGLFTRSTVTATTSSLASGASDSATTIALGKGFALYAISTSKLARVTLYETAAALAADASRLVGVDPASDAGVILDYVTADTAQRKLSPIVLGSSMEGTPSANISMRVVNMDASTGTITVSLVAVRVE